MPAKKASPTPIRKRAAKKAAPSSPRPPRAKAAAANPSSPPLRSVADPTVTAPPSDRPSWRLPLTDWHISAPPLPALPSVPETVTLPVVGWTVSAGRRESMVYYAVLGGFVAAEVIDWPIALLLFAGHALAHQSRYRGLEGAAEAFEEA